MAKRRNTQSRRSTQSGGQRPIDLQRNESSRFDQNAQDQPQEERAQPNRRARRASIEYGSGNSIHYAALIALAVVIGSAGFYFQQGSSTSGATRHTRAPSLARRTVPLAGDSCDPKTVNSVCLYDSGDGYAFCNSRGFLERAGNAPPGQSCRDVVFGCRTKGVSFVVSGTTTSDIGTTVNPMSCDPLTIDSVCLTKDTYGKCGSDRQVVNMGSVAPGTTCSYAFTEGVARVVQVFATPENLRNYAMNEILWMWSSRTRDGRLMASMKPGDYCGSETTICTSTTSALKCSQRTWSNVTCSTCVQQDTATAFVSDTCSDVDT